VEQFLSAPVTIDTDWHELKLHWHTSATGYGEAFMDNVEVASTLTYDNTFLGNNAVFRVGVMNNGNAPYTVASIAFDDITISDTDTIGEDPALEPDPKTFYGMPFIILQVLGAVLSIIGVMQLRKKKR
jgi:hypothetical protein